MNVTDVMQQLADQLGTIPEINVYAYTVDKPEAPAAVVSLPESIDFDQTYGRGSDEITIPVFVLVSRVSDHSAHRAIAEYADGSGARSVKQVIEAGTYTACDTVTVARVSDFDFIEWGGPSFLVAEFTLDITGSGS